jgi:hypothetical protein
MILRNRHAHGVAFGAGLVLGLSLAGGHPWLLLAVGFALGALASTFVRLGRRLAGYAAERLRAPAPDVTPAAGVRETRAELISRLHTDVSLLAATLPRPRRRGHRDEERR